MSMSLKLHGKSRHFDIFVRLVISQIARSGLIFCRNLSDFDADRSTIFRKEALELSGIVCCN